MVTPLLKQTWTVSAVLLNMIGQGTLLSYHTHLLPALQQPDSPIKADLHTASWLVSSLGPASILGHVSSSILLYIFGRKLTQILMLVSGIIGWLAIYWAQNFSTLLVGKILGSISASSCIIIGAIIIGEYSDPKYRGMFLNLKVAFINFGILFTHVLGHYLSRRNLALACVFPYIIALVMVLTWYESPPWLASKGKFNESKKSFLWLRGNSEASKKELEVLLKAQRERLAKPIVVNSLTDMTMRSLTKFTKKDFLKPLFIMMISFILLEASGRHIFPTHALQIIEEVVGNKSQTVYYTLGIDIIITASILCSSMLVKKVKRRTLLFSTGFSARAVLVVACTYIIFAAYEILPKSQSWLAIAIFMVYYLLANLACTTMPFVLIGEIFPLSHRETGSAVVGCFIALCIMISLQITPCILINTKIYGTFLISGVIMCLMLIILYFVLPETKDKTLQEIEDIFNDDKFKADGNNYEEDISEYQQHNVTSQHSQK